LKGLETLMGTAERVRKRFNPNLRLLGVTLGNVDGQARLDADIRQMLRDKFGADQVFQTVISRSVKHREAPVYGRVIFEHAPGTPAAAQFADLARETAERLGGRAPVAEEEAGAGPAEPPAEPLVEAAAHG
jgi:chromosome partitioning protein